MVNTSFSLYNTVRHTCYGVLKEVSKRCLFYLIAKAFSASLISFMATRLLEVLSKTS